MQDDRLVGIFTESDLVSRVVAQDLDARSTLLEQVMTREPATVQSTDTVGDAIRAMHECGFQHLPVVDGQRVAAMISWRDLPMNELACIQDELNTREVLAEQLR